MTKFLTFLTDKECIKKVHKLTSNVALSFKVDA